MQPIFDHRSKIRKSENNTKFFRHGLLPSGHEKKNWPLGLMFPEASWLMPSFKSYLNGKYQLFSSVRSTAGCL